MTSPAPTAARQFAIEVVARLREAGYQALWAGGCVRDQLLGIEPKDYDVATSAEPDQIRDLFGRRRTLAIGQSFGVITVLGPKDVGQLDVATFRSDLGYSDGRHPDSVSFTSAEEDAKRRDFTINGLFLDPLENRVLDYVGGQEDLRQGIIRAIGDPEQRIAEDKLRMLRAVRFAARFGFAIEDATLSAIQRHNGELIVVSAERIAAEMRHILTHASRACGIALLDKARVLEVALPEAAKLASADEPWQRTLNILHRLQTPTFAMALAALVREMVPADSEPKLGLATTICERWKLTNHETSGVLKLLAEESVIRRAATIPWPQLQRILIAPRVDELLGYAEAVAAVVDQTTEAVEYCRAKLALPADELNPPTLITGDDLKKAGISPGPSYRDILDAVRDAQLEKGLRTKDDALAMAKRLHESPKL